VPRVLLQGVEHCNGCGGHCDLLRHSKLRIPGSMSTGDRALGANVQTQEGNNPDRQLRSPILTKWETKWEGIDSQEVGLEAAIL